LNSRPACGSEPFTKKSATSARDIKMQSTCLVTQYTSRSTTCSCSLDQYQWMADQFSTSSGSTGGNTVLYTYTDVFVIKPQTSIFKSVQPTMNPSLSPPTAKPSSTIDQIVTALSTFRYIFIAVLVVCVCAPVIGALYFKIIRKKRLDKLTVLGKRGIVWSDIKDVHDIDVHSIPRSNLQSTLVELYAINTELHKKLRFSRYSYKALSYTELSQGEINTTNDASFRNHIRGLYDQNMSLKKLHDLIISDQRGITVQDKLQFYLDVGFTGDITNIVEKINVAGHSQHQKFSYRNLSLKDVDNHSGNTVNSSISQYSGSRLLQNFSPRKQLHPLSPSKRGKPKNLIMPSTLAEKKSEILNSSTRSNDPEVDDWWSMELDFKDLLVERNAVFHVTDIYPNQQDDNMEDNFVSSLSNKLPVLATNRAHRSQTFTTKVLLPENWKEALSNSKDHQ
jgi:hypothetical protein